MTDAMSLHPTLVPMLDPRRPPSSSSSSGAAAHDAAPPPGRATSTYATQSLPIAAVPMPQSWHLSPSPSSTHARGFGVPAHAAPATGSAASSSSHHAPPTDQQHRHQPQYQQPMASSNGAPYPIYYYANFLPPQNNSQTQLLPQYAASSQQQQSQHLHYGGSGGQAAGQQQPQQHVMHFPVASTSAQPWQQSSHVSGHAQAMTSQKHAQSSAGPLDPSLFSEARNPASRQNGVTQQHPTQASQQSQLKKSRSLNDSGYGEAFQDDSPNVSVQDQQSFDDEELDADLSNRYSTVSQIEAQPVLDPDTGEANYPCPFCDKHYGGKHGRSIWRRHLCNKHGIPLNLQPRKTRWDNDANRPKDEAERHKRTLESKRRWAAKNRAEKRAKKKGTTVEEELGLIEAAEGRLGQDDSASYGDEQSPLPMHPSSSSLKNMDYAASPRMQHAQQLQNQQLSAQRATSSVQQQQQGLSQVPLLRFGHEQQDFSVERMQMQQKQLQGATSPNVAQNHQQAGYTMGMQSQNTQGGLSPRPASATVSDTGSNFIPYSRSPARPHGAQQPAIAAPSPAGQDLRASHSPAPAVFYDFAHAPIPLSQAQSVPYYYQILSPALSMSGLTPQANQEGSSHALQRSLSDFGANQLSPQAGNAMSQTAQAPALYLALPGSAQPHLLQRSVSAPSGVGLGLSLERNGLQPPRPLDLSDPMHHQQRSGSYDPQTSHAALSPSSYPLALSEHSDQQMTTDMPHSAGWTPRQSVFPQNVQQLVPGSQPQPPTPYFYLSIPDQPQSAGFAPSPAQSYGSAPSPVPAQQQQQNSLPDLTMSKAPAILEPSQEQSQQQHQIKAAMQLAPALEVTEQEADTAAFAAAVQRSQQPSPAVLQLPLQLPRRRSETRKKAVQEEPSAQVASQLPPVRKATKGGRSPSPRRKPTSKTALAKVNKEAAMQLLALKTSSSSPPRSDPLDLPDVDFAMDYSARGGIDDSGYAATSGDETQKDGSMATQLDAEDRMDAERSAEDGRDAHKRTRFVSIPPSSPVPRMSLSPSSSPVFAVPSKPSTALAKSKAVGSLSTSTRKRSSSTLVDENDENVFSRGRYAGAGEKISLESSPEREEPPLSRRRLLSSSPVSPRQQRVASRSPSPGARHSGPASSNVGSSRFATSVVMSTPHAGGLFKSRQSGDVNSSANATESEEEEVRPKKQIGEPMKAIRHPGSIFKVDNCSRPSAGLGMTSSSSPVRPFLLSSPEHAAVSRSLGLVPDTFTHTSLSLPGESEAFEMQFLRGFGNHSMGMSEYAKDVFGGPLNERD